MCIIIHNELGQPIDKRITDNCLRLNGGKVGYLSLDTNQVKTVDRESFHDLAQTRCVIHIKNYDSNDPYAVYPVQIGQQDNTRNLFINGTIRGLYTESMINDMRKILTQIEDMDDLLKVFSVFFYRTRAILHYRHTDGKYYVIKFGSHKDGSMYNWTMKGKAVWFSNAKVLI